MEDRLRAFDELVGGSRRVLTFTGAGVSEESGIPTFRGRGGIWERYSPAVYGNLPGLAAVFLFRGKRLAGFAAEVVSTLVEASPNPCHQALARMEKEGRLEGIITQNVDDLHSRAGSERVLELHGNAYRTRCRRCRSTRKLEKERLEDVAEKLESPGINRRKMLRALREYASSCDKCGGRTRPDMVFFGESLPAGVMDESLELASRCDLMMVLGTASVVYPAAMIPRAAVEGGAKLVEVNPAPTVLTAAADLSIMLPAGEFFSHYIQRPDQP